MTWAELDVLAKADPDMRPASEQTPPEPVVSERGGAFDARFFAALPLGG